MPNGESPLEETTNQEYEKAPAEAKARNYFDILGDQFIQTFKAIKTTTKVAFTGAVLAVPNFIGYALVGLDAVATSFGFIFGNWLAKWKNKEKITVKDTIVRGTGGVILGTFLHYFFPFVHRIGDNAGAMVKAATGSSAYGTATQIATKSGIFLGPGFPAYIGLDDITRSTMDPSYKRPKGKDFWKSNTRALKYLGLPVALNANFTRPYLGTQFEVPIGALLSTIYAYISSKPPGKKEENNVVEMPQTRGQQQYRQQQQRAA